MVIAQVIVYDVRCAAERTIVCEEDWPGRIDVMFDDTMWLPQVTFDAEFCERLERAKAIGAS
jgi:hypothetical protein